MRLGHHLLDALAVHRNIQREKKMNELVLEFWMMADKSNSSLRNSSQLLCDKQLRRFVNVVKS